MLWWCAPPAPSARAIVYIEANFISPPPSSSLLLCLHPPLYHSSLSIPCSFTTRPLVSTNVVAPLCPNFPPPLLFLPTSACLSSTLHAVLCPAASESVLLQQLFQSKLTQTGSLVQAVQGRAGLRGPKAALLLHRKPSASLLTANTVTKQPRRNLDLTKVQ